MGLYLNPDNKDFQRAINSEIYIDKSMLIAYTNKCLYTEQGYICVSRPRRFGKSMAANMLTAYYSKGCDSKEMFSELKIAQDESFGKHLNQYNVIHLDMTKFLGESKDCTELKQIIEEYLIDEICDEFSGFSMPRRVTLINVLEKVYQQFKIPFIFIIDEWDCVFREWKNDSESQKIYLTFLRDLIKGKSYLALAYMTGILPIKKYEDVSAQASINTQKA